VVSDLVDSCTEPCSFDMRKRMQSGPYMFVVECEQITPEFTFSIPDLSYDISLVGTKYLMVADP
jgi:hypothetical protein